jgi:hypothetical protein
MVSDGVPPSAAGLDTRSSPPARSMLATVLVAVRISVPVPAFCSRKGPETGPLMVSCVSFT